VPCGLPGAQARPPDLEFFRAPDSSTNSFFPKNDNKCIGAPVRPKAHQVLLMRAIGGDVYAGDYGRAMAALDGESALLVDVQ
jgi:hypothetical protein